MYAITRIDTESNGTRAWTVTVQRRGRIHHRYFTDGVHGGKRQALRAAIAYRDQLLTTLRPLSRRAFCSIKKKNNRSGVVGVTRLSRVQRKGGRTWQADCWVAVWPIDGKRSQQKKFSVKKYGEQGAFVLAVKARRTALRMLQGPIGQSHPESRSI